MPTLSAAGAFLALASIPFSAAQRYDGQYWPCNPTVNASCPPNVGLAQSSYHVDFTQPSPNWTVANNEIVTNGPNGAQFTFYKRFDAPQLWSNFYILFGRVEVVMQVAPGAGIISSSVLMSDDFDEIDWEISGNNFGNAGSIGMVQNNYFGKGVTGNYDRGSFANTANPQGSFHTYAVDWSTTQIAWSIDGKVVRTLLASDCKGSAHQFPQTPSKIQLGLWDGGDTSSDDGTVAWAGGYSNLSAAPFTMYVKSVTIMNANPASGYNWTDQSGSWQSIKALTDWNGNNSVACFSSVPSSTTTESSSQESSSSAVTSKSGTSTLSSSSGSHITSSKVTMTTSSVINGGVNFGSWVGWADFYGSLKTASFCSGLSDAKASTAFQSTVRVSSCTAHNALPTHYYATGVIPTTTTTTTITTDNSISISNTARVGSSTTNVASAVYTSTGSKSASIGSTRTSVGSNSISMGSTSTGIGSTYASVSGSAASSTGELLSYDKLHIASTNIAYTCMCSSSAVYSSPSAFASSSMATFVAGAPVTANREASAAVVTGGQNTSTPGTSMNVPSSSPLTPGTTHSTSTFLKTVSSSTTSFVSATSPKPQLTSSSHSTSTTSHILATSPTPSSVSSTHSSNCPTSHISTSSSKPSSTSASHSNSTTSHIPVTSTTHLSISSSYSTTSTPSLCPTSHSSVWSAAPNGSPFTIRCSTDFPSCDIHHYTGCGSLAECAFSCSQNKDCHACVFQENGNDCYLKNFTASMPSGVAAPATHCALKTDSGCANLNSYLKGQSGGWNYGALTGGRWKRNVVPEPEVSSAASSGVSTGMKSHTGIKKHTRTKKGYSGKNSGSHTKAGTKAHASGGHNGHGHEHHHMH